MVTILGPSRQMHSREFMASQLTLSRVSPGKKVHSEKVNSTLLVSISGLLPVLNFLAAIKKRSS